GRHRRRVVVDDRAGAGAGVAGTATERLGRVPPELAPVDGPAHARDPVALLRRGAVADERAGPGGGGPALRRRPYRLLSLTDPIFPGDRPRSGPGAAPVVGPRPRRPSREVGPEISWLALSLALWTGLAVLARFIVGDDGVNGLGFAPEAWRVVSLVWLA